MKLKKIMKWSVITMAMMAGICFAPQSGKAAEKLEVKIPTERAIYQRDNNNYANVKVSIEYSGTGEVSAKLYDGDKELGKTAVLTKGEGNTYEGSIANVPGGGWYTLIVKRDTSDFFFVIVNNNVFSIQSQIAILGSYI